MIDWYGVAVSALWILGLAVLLAALSHARWQSGQEEKSLRQTLSAPSSHLTIAVGVVLLAAGVALSVDTGWERIGWTAVLALAAWESITAWREWHTKIRGG